MGVRGAGANRMLKQSLFSPAQPWRAETRLFPLHRSRIVQTLNVPHSENKLSWQLGVGG